jgi:hypothetical protein
MKRGVRSVAMGLLLVGLTALSALAQNVHFKGGDPDFADLGTVLQSDLCLAGLGNEDVTITVTAMGTPTTTCTNRGGTQAPGQNPGTLTLVGGLTISADEIQNGNVCVTVSTLAPGTPSAQDAGCPNGNWSAAIRDVLFTSATITVMQGGMTVLSDTFTP